jgi:hypothetical protein
VPITAIAAIKAVVFAVNIVSSNAKLSFIRDSQHTSPLMTKKSVQWYNWREIRFVI